MTHHRTSLLRDLADRHGTPFYVYDLDHIRRRVESLRTAFENRFEIGYAVKANPNLLLLQRLAYLVDHLDVSSGGELKAALGAGWEAGKIGFTGPAKRPNELELGLGSRIGHIVLESLEEARQLDRMAAELGVRQPVLVRIAPKRVPRGFGLSLAGRPCRFGIDEEDLESALKHILRLPTLDLRGFHIFSGTQCLDAASMAENYRIYTDIFRRFSEALDITPSRLIFGAGLGIPYHEGDQPVDLQSLAAEVNRDLDKFTADPRFASARCVLESGRYLVGEAGLYITRVLRLKHSRGSDIAVCDGGMHHHLAACGLLGSVIRRNYPIFKVGEPEARGDLRSYQLVGPLCTSIDTLGSDVQLSELKVGDLIAVGCSGAYGLTASPINFLSHPAAAEHLIESDNIIS